QDVAVVIERVAGIVHRQQGAGVHIQLEDVADGVAVFRAVQPVDCRMPGIRVRRGFGIQRGFQPLAETGGGRDVGPRQARRRHLTALELSEHFLQQLGVIADTGGIQPLQSHTGCLELVIVADDAVALEQGWLAQGARGTHDTDKNADRRRGDRPKEYLAHEPSPDTARSSVQYQDYRLCIRSKTVKPSRLPLRNVTQPNPTQPNPTLTHRPRSVPGGLLDTPPISTVSKWPSSDGTIGTDSDIMKRGHKTGSITRKRSKCFRQPMVRWRSTRWRSAFNYRRHRPSGCSERWRHRVASGRANGANTRWRRA